MNSKKKYINIILLTLGILVLLNILASKHFFRLDFTEDSRYTLSESTSNILEELIEPVTIKAYFSKNLPPQLDNIRRDFRDMLVEYSEASKGMLVYEFIDPLDKENGEMEAQQAGIMQMQVQVREKDQMKAQIAYMGAVIEIGEGKEAIPMIQSASGMEYAITSNIKKLSVMDKPAVGLLTGHGESGLQKIAQSAADLSILYQVEDVTLNDSTPELAKYKAVAVIGPTDSLPDSHLEQLTDYVSNGGNLLVAINRVDVDMNNGFNMGKSITTGLETWLSKLGISVNNNFVIDANAAQVMVSRQQGPFTVQQPVVFPYIPRIENFNEHPVVNGLEQLIFQFASSIDYMGDTSLNYKPILYSSTMSATKPASTFIDLGYEWKEEDFPLNRLTMAAALEGKILDKEAKLVVIGDANFPVSEGQQQIHPDNANLLVNAIDWLSDDTGLLELRTRGATARPIDEMEDFTKGLIKYLNFLVPILLAIGYGIFRMQRNKIIKIKRRGVGYV